MKRSFYNTRFVADKYYEDAYLWEGEVLFLKAFLINSFQDYYSGKEIISLNLLGTVKTFFQNSAWYSLARLKCYKDLLDLGVNLNIDTDIKTPESKVFLKKKNTGEIYIKQQKLFTLLKKHKTLEEITSRKQILRLLDDNDTSSCSGLIFVTFEKISKLKEVIKQFLNNYLNKYEANMLSYPGKNIYSKERHFELFHSLLKGFNDFDKASICISRLDIENRAKKCLTKDCDVSQFRPLEFFMFLEKQGFLEIKDVGFRGLIATSSEPCWEVDLKILKTIEEIGNIGENNSECGDSETEKTMFEFPQIFYDEETTEGHTNGRQFYLGDELDAKVFNELYLAINKPVNRKKIVGLMKLSPSQSNISSYDIGELVKRLRRKAHLDKKTLLLQGNLTLKGKKICNPHRIT